MSDKLNKNILATIVYYSGLKYPLTAFEIWKNLIRTDYYDNKNQNVQVSLAEIMKQLEDENLKKYIENKNGFYFLKGESHLVERRIKNNKISAKKIDRLFGIAKWLRFVPFVRMIGMTGALAMKNGNVKSDLDILVVLKNKKIWTGRTLVTLFLHIIAKRRHNKKTTDRVCLNYFITDESLEIVNKDLFAASEYMFLFPLYGWKTFQRFQIKNQWIRNMKISYALCEIRPLKTIRDSYLSKTIRTAGEIVLSAKRVEEWLKRIEKKRIMQNPKTHQEGSMVYADDSALIFLPEPHGPKVFEQFKERVEQLSI